MNGNRTAGFGAAILATSLVVGAYALLGHSDMPPDIVKRADVVFDKGVRKCLQINISSDGVGFGRHIRFYDTNGDGKTVEQYVELYNVSAGFPSPSNVLVDLVRPGAKCVYGGERDPLMKTMTKDQMATLDSVYQELLSHQRSGYLRD